MYLSIRTDKPEAELGLFDGQTEVDYLVWPANRQLSAQIHQKIEDLLKRNHQKYETLNGLLVFKGPGSFTGLRIGASVANGLANGLDLPIISRGGEDWLIEATKSLEHGLNEKNAVPFYGAQPKTTKPTK